MRVLWILVLVASVTWAALHLGFQQGLSPVTELGSFLFSAAPLQSTPAVLAADWLITGTVVLVLLGYLVFAAADSAGASRAVARLRRLDEDDAGRAPIEDRLAGAVAPFRPLRYTVPMLAETAGKGAGRRSTLAAELSLRLSLGMDALVDGPLLRRFFEALPLFAAAVTLILLIWQLVASMTSGVAETPTAAPVMEAAEAIADAPFLITAILMAIATRLIVGLVLEARHRQTRTLLLELGLALDGMRARAGDVAAGREALSLRRLEEILELSLPKFERIVERIDVLSGTSPTPVSIPTTGDTLTSSASPPLASYPRAHDAADDGVVSEVAAFVAEARADLNRYQSVGDERGENEGRWRNDENGASRAARVPWPR